MRLPLTGGSYTARSIIASAQRCINLFPELNPRDALCPTTHYQRPGLRKILSPPISGFGRGLYRSSNGYLYAVVGSKLLLINPDLTITTLGDILSNSQIPVSMVDNGATLVVVDGSANGFTADLLTNAFGPIVDTTGTFQGARKVDYLDTFLVFGPVPPNSGSNQFISSTSNLVQFNALFVGGKTDYPDPLATLIVNRHELLLIGELKSEIWYDAGNPQLPFAELPGAFIEHGTPAPYSVASSDISVFWLGQDLQGDGVVFRQRGYLTTRISNHALEYALRQIKKAGGLLSDCVGYTYQQDGHYFYVMNFPSGDQTWVFDDSVGDPMLAWHQRCWADLDGSLHRDRVQCGAFAYGRNWGLDWQDGTIFELDPEYYFDDHQGISYPVQYIRTFPHVGKGLDENGQMIEADGRQVQYHGFMLDIEAGTIPPQGALLPEVTVRYSDDRGRTYSGSVLLQLGPEGAYLTWPTLKGGLGIARDRMWEVQWAGDGATALNGAWIDGKVLHD